MTPTLSLNAARSVQVAAQGLLQAPAQPATKTAALAAIRRMGALQIDTIHVVARSPYLVLWSRLGDYEPAWLDELLAEGALFEYWSHAACFLPIEDYPLYHRRMLGRLNDWRDRQAWMEEHRPLVESILERIRLEGALRSADFENPRTSSGGWWNWKEEKIALEYLHTTGALMIARRVNFQRVYDLTERVRPAWAADGVPSKVEMLRTLTLRTVQILGVTQARWVADYFRLPKTGIPGLLEELAQAGELLRLEVEGWPAPAYAHPANLPLLESAGRGELNPTLTTLLSPFDPLVWDRARCKAVFGFDYTIECYLPAAKRRFGYFSLPILARGQLVGRLDAKAHRQAGRFEIRALHLEAGTTLDETQMNEVRCAIQRCAAWHRTPLVVTSDPSANWAAERVVTNASFDLE